MNNKKYRLRKTSKFNPWAIHFNYSRRLWGAKDAERKKCLELSRIRVTNGFKFRCFHCGQFFPYFQIQVDHTIPIANSMPQTKSEFLECFEKLFVTADKLQVLCKDCHKFKTKIELSERKNLQ